MSPAKIVCEYKFKEKKMFKKKAVVVLVFLALSRSLFAGGAKQEQAAGAPKEVITYWHTASEAMGGKTIEELVKKFNDSNGGIEVVPVFNAGYYEGLLQNLQAEAAAGKSPAIIQCAYSFLEYFPNNFGYISPNDIIAKYFQADKPYLNNTFADSMLKLATDSKGVLIGLPYSVSSPVLFYNKDLFAAAGLSGTAPQTWEQVVDYAMQIKAKTGKYGIYLQEGDTFVFQAILESNGGKMVTWNGGKARAAFNSPEGVKAIQAYADMVLKEKSAVSLSASADGVKAFLDGEVAMIITSIAQRRNVQTNARFAVDAANFPSWQGKKRVLPAGGSFLAITAQKEAEQKAAWEFIKYLYQDDSVAAWTIGTGYIPPTKNAADSEALKAFIDSNKMMTAATSQVADVGSWTAYPGDAGLKALQIVVDARAQILTGKRSVADALKDAEDQINKILP
jgi:multiple sugar transport system substrate-binding protein/sn-glycerol 3-phosphate transport system substrate-binding protein